MNTESFGEIQVPLNIPTFEQISSIARAALPRFVSGVNPSILASWQRYFIEGFALATHSLTGPIRDLYLDMFPQTARRDALIRFLEYEGLSVLPAVGSVGAITQEGDVGTVIPTSTVYVIGANQYTVNTGTSIQTQGFTVSSMTRSGNIVTVKSLNNHPYASGMTITHAGADQSDYNGEHVITVTGYDEYTFEIETTPPTPATGTITSTGTFAALNVTSVLDGTDTNISGGTGLSLQGSIEGISGQAVTQFGGLSGGGDIESTEAIRQRVLLSRSTRGGVFTADQIRLAVFSINGNTRAFVKRATTSGAGGALDPMSGQVSIFFLRDEDTNPIPTPTIIAQTKQAIIDDGMLPANSSEADVFVQGPTLTDTNFVIGSLTPDTPTMRSSIQANLRAQINDNSEFEATVTRATYLSYINSTQDTVTGDTVTSFSVTTPPGDIVPGSGGIVSVGDITF